MIYMPNKKIHMRLVTMQMHALFEAVRTDIRLRTINVLRQNVHRLILPLFKMLVNAAPAADGN